MMWWNNIFQKIILTMIAYSPTFFKSRLALSSIFVIINLFRLVTPFLGKKNVQLKAIVIPNKSDRILNF
jgi:hypothetical protein